MNIFGVGLLEVLLILIVALMVVGPHRLPETAAQLGRTVRSIRRYAADVTSQVREELADLEAEYEAMKAETERARQSLSESSTVIEGEVRTLEEDIDRSTSEINRAIQEEPSGTTSAVQTEASEDDRPTNVVPLDRHDTQR